jgi:hypothetical protein
VIILIKVIAETDPEKWNPPAHATNGNNSSSTLVVKHAATVSSETKTSASSSVFPEAQQESDP